MVMFDYSTEAELFPARNRKYGRRPVRYRRFARAADAVRFAIEELPPELLLGAFWRSTEKDMAAKKFVACTTTPIFR